MSSEIDMIGFGYVRFGYEPSVRCTGLPVPIVGGFDEFPGDFARNHLEPQTLPTPLKRWACPRRSRRGPCPLVDR